MITLKAEPNLSQVRLGRDNRSDLIFQGFMLSRQNMLRKTGMTRERHGLALYKTRTGRYVLATSTLRTMAGFRPIHAYQALCFSCMNDVRTFLQQEHPMPDPMAEDLIAAAHHADWNDLRAVIEPTIDIRRQSRGLH